MRHRPRAFGLIALVFAGGLSGCITTGTTPVAGGSAIAGASGAAAGATSTDAASNLERCDSPLGTIAVDDGRGREWFNAWGAATKVTNIEPLIRLVVQQSNCFVITSIGSTRADARMSQITERQRSSGEFRAGSAQQAGQRVAADYFLEPAIIIGNSPTGQMAGQVGGMLARSLGLGMLGNVATNLAGQVEVRSSVVTLTLMDIRSQTQIGISEGSATSTNVGAAMSAFGSGAGGALRGFQTTPEGKATVTAFVDAYNKLVVATRNYRAQEVSGGAGRGGRLRVQP